MRLLSLTVRNYRVHKELTVTFDPSRTLIGGPNESGKSTLAEAAHRALFLRAKTSGSLRDEMRSSLHQGEPEVVLAFEAVGTRWKLEKRFAGAKGSMLLSDASGKVHRDDEAETKLSELLKSETASGRGAAGQLPGLWSHLWVWQGQAGEEPAAHTTREKENLVRHLQHHSTSAVLQSATDQRAASSIAGVYAELFTAGGKSKAGSKPELARVWLEEATSALEKARETSRRLAQAADDDARAESEMADAHAQLPKLRENQAATEARLREVEALRRNEETQRLSHHAATARREELETHDRKIRELQTRLASETAALQPAESELTTLVEVERNTRAVSDAAEAALKEKTETLRRARLHHDLAVAAIAAFEKNEAHQALAGRAAEAAMLQTELAALRADLAKWPLVDSKDLTQLRKLETSVTQANAALNAMATGVELLDASIPVHLDGETLGPGESRIVTEAGELRIGDSAQLRIRPGGGSSLEDARRQTADARAALDAELQKLALRDPEHAALALEQRQALEAKINGLEGRWNALGGAELAAALGEAAAQRDTAREEFQRRIALALETVPLDAPADLPTARERTAVARSSLSAAEATETTARQQVEHLREKLETAAGALARHREQNTAARQSLRDLETSIKIREETHGEETARAQAIAAAREIEAQTTEQLTVTRSALAALNPELLVADLERYTRARAAQEIRLREAETARLLARDRLILDGSADPEAELHFAESRHRAAVKTHASEIRRARAIELLHQLFSDSREAIDRALVQPLADRITGYLRCLFGPGASARVQLTDQGIESLELIRADDPAFSFTILSGGAKEQVAAAVRLALAEILAGDHDGCLPVLFDDAFAYSDPDRIQFLQRMLDLAAVRGLQVIILTCTPTDYSAFGAREVRLHKVEK